MARFEEIETFVAIAELGSLTAVSQRKGLALSAVSRRLKDLESRLGRTLIQRSTRKLRLTEDGEEFYRLCSHALSEIDAAETILQDRASTLSGPIRITAPASFSLLHLSAPLSSFLEAHPTVQLDLDLSDRRIDLLEEGYDFAVRVGRLPDSSLIAKRLTRIRHLPCASPELLRRLGHPERPEDLETFPALAYRPRGRKTRWRFTRPDGTVGEVSAAVRVQSSNGDILCQQAVAGLGVIIEPTFITAPELLAGRLVPLFLDHLWSDNAAFIVYPPSQPLSRRVRALIDHLSMSLPAEPDWDRAIRDKYPAFTTL